MPLMETLIYDLHYLHVVEFSTTYCFCLCLKGVGILDRIVNVGLGLGEISLAFDKRGDMFHM